MATPYEMLQRRIVSDRTPPTGAAGLRLFPSATPQAPTTETSASPDLINRMLQVMSGQLGGTLSGGEKLSALGALLKSVSRGSQTSPQQVMQSIQQQKLQEVQGALQIQELRKQAQRQAQAELQRQQLIDQEKDPRRKAMLQLASAEDIGAIAREEFKYRDPNQGLTAIEQQLARLYGLNTPKFYQALDAYLRQPKILTGPGGAQFETPGLDIPQRDLTEVEVLGQARQAISSGADPEKVKARVRSLGYDDGKL